MREVTKVEKIVYAFKYARDKKRLGVSFNKAYIDLLDMWIIYISESDTVLVDNMTEHEATLLLEELNKVGELTS